MASPKLNVNSRNAAEKGASSLRRAGKIPAVVYGPGVGSRSIEVDAIAFRKVWGEAGESSLLDLVVDETAPVKVLIHDTQIDPMKDAVSHVDFLQVNMTEKLRTDILLEFVGESAAVKALGGTLVKNRDAVEVECLPGDLVAHLSVDISSLHTFDDIIRVKDITFPPGVVPVTDGEEVLALVDAPRSEEELKALEGAVETSVETVEVEKKGKEEEVGEEGAEGAEKKDAKK